MIRGHRTAGLALLGVCAAAWIIVPGRMAAQPRPIGVQTVQPGQPMTPEPPISEGYASGAPSGGSSVVDPPVPVVTVRVRVPASVTAGQELTYRILVENTSNAAAHRVRVRASQPTHASLVSVKPEPEKKEADPKETELTWSFGTLAARGSKEITLVVKSDGSGEVQTTARVSFEHGQTVITRLNQPSLRIRKIGPTEAILDSPIKFALEIVNDGAAAAEEVEVTDTLPEGLQFSDSKPPTPGNNPLRWTFATLPSGKTERIEYTVIPKKLGELRNSARVAAKGNISETAQATVVVGQPKLSISTTGPALGVPGQSLAYTITVTNTGNVTAPNVVILDRIPQERAPQNQSPVVEFLSAARGGRYEQGAVRWPLGNLPAGASRSVQLTLRVNQFGKLRNVAEVQAEQTLPEKAEALTFIVNPNNRITLDIDKPQTPLEAGGEAVYTVRVINSANAPIDGVALTVSATENLSLVKAVPTNGIADKDKIQFGSLTTIPPGQIREYAITVRALQQGEATFQARADVNPSLAGFPMILKSTTQILPASARP
jgi:uncharacterized repeat protein (TIGR01451 family)